MKKILALSLLVTLLLSAKALADIGFTTSTGYVYSKARPSFIRGGSDFGWRDMTWESWGGKMARGQGNAYDRNYVEADQQYEVFLYPVKMKLTVIRRCVGRLIYTRQTVTYTGELPAPDTPPTEVNNYRCPRTYLPSRCTNQKERPRSVIVACGDGNFQLRRMRWRRWGFPTARGAGTARANDCIPFCAAGKFRSVRVKITLSRLKPCGDGLQYRRLRYRFVGSIPSQLRGRKRSGSVPFPCVQ